MTQQTKTNLGRGTLLFLIILGFLLASGSLISLSYLDGREKVSKQPVIQRFDTSIRNFHNIIQANLARINRLDSSVSFLHSQFAAFDSYKQAAPSVIGAKPAVEKFRKLSDTLSESLEKHMQMLKMQKVNILQLQNVMGNAYRRELVRLESLFRTEEAKLPASLASEFAQRINHQISSLKYEDCINENISSFLTNANQLFQSLILSFNNLKRSFEYLTQNPDAPFIQSAYLASDLPNAASYKVMNMDIKPDKAYTDPVPNKIMQDWGWVSVLFGWMVVPNNVDFVLLIGMLGFGLFGAGINIYITNKPEEVDASLAKNIMLVIVRGFAASIVVFLAMKGGIATLNSGESNPNPIILFLFCFIGAVFSDPIWAWAKEKINGAFPSKLEDRKPNPEVPLKTPKLDDEANKPEIPKKVE